MGEKKKEKIKIDTVKDKEEDQSSLKIEEKDDICSEVEMPKEKITTKEDQIAESHKKEKEKEKVGKEIIKDKENAKDEITTKEDQIAEIEKKEKEIEKIEIESIKDTDDDQSSPKIEEQEVDICSEVENAKDEN